MFRFYRKKLSITITYPIPTVTHPPRHKAFLVPNEERNTKIRTKWGIGTLETPTCVDLYFTTVTCTCYCTWSVRGFPDCAHRQRRARQSAPPSGGTICSSVFPRSGVSQQRWMR